MTSYFTEVFSAAWNTCQGLLLTLKYLLKPSVTVHYPDEKLLPYERFRGALLFDAQTCISCNLCVKACPSTCIALENATVPDPKNPAVKKKIAKVEWYTIDFGKCNFCRLCEESCPTKPKSVWHSLDYELLFFSRDEMVRCWKAGIGWVGKYWDRADKQFKDPRGQVQIMEPNARR